jgi:hypothetical protein
MSRPYTGVKAEIIWALTEALHEDHALTVRDLLKHCPSANDTTDVAKAVLDLHQREVIAREGSAGKFTYRLIDHKERGINAAVKAIASQSPKPGVGQNPGSAEETSPSVPDRAVAATASTPRATPAPKPERRGSGPAPAKASAGDVYVKPRIEINLCSDGTLTIDLPDAATIHLEADQILALGDFLHQTQNFWRP